MGVHGRSVDWIAERGLRTARFELRGAHPRLFLARLLMLALPLQSGSRVRAGLLRMAGARIGRGVVVLSAPRLFGPGPIARRLAIGDHCMINVGATFDLAEEITLGSWVALAPDVMLLTSSHDIGPSEHRWGVSRNAPIVIGDGAWIGARATVLPGVVIGPGAIVAAGSMVTEHVDANSLVAGVPARPVRRLDDVE